MGQEPEEVTMQSVRRHVSSLSPESDPSVVLKDVQQLVSLDRLNNKLLRAIYDVFMESEHYECAAMFAKQYSINHQLQERAAIEAIRRHAAALDPTSTPIFILEPIEELVEEYGLSKEALMSVQEILIMTGHEDRAAEFAERHGLRKLAP